MRRTRKNWAAALAVLAVVPMLVSSCTNAASSLDEPEHTGVAIQADHGGVGDWSGFTDGQCVHGVYQFYLHRFGLSLTGACAQPGNLGNCQNCGACMIWKSPAVEPSPSLFNRYAWGTTMPQTYDIVVYPPKTAAVGPGHVACVDHIDGADPAAWGSLYVMDSNWHGDEKMAATVHTVTRAPYGIFRLKSLDNPAPKGYLDVADCSSIGGWTQDPSDATAAISADLYFDGAAGDPAAKGIRLNAGEDRADLCAPLGSCNHAYAMATPRGAMDGKPHTVYAYGIDSAGGQNPLLSDAPKTFTCDAPALPSHVTRRWVTSPSVVTAWAFQLFFDMAIEPSAALDALPSSADAPAAPSLLKATNADTVYVVDKGAIRPIAGPKSFAAWRFSADLINEVDASELETYAPGLDWPGTPLLVKSPDSDKVFLLDTEPPMPPPSMSSSSSSGAGGSSSAASSGDPFGETADGRHAGCSVAPAKDSTAPSTLWIASILSVIVGAFGARRRSKAS